jgi:hypothetical protein
MIRDNPQSCSSSVYQVLCYSIFDNWSRKKQYVNFRVFDKNLHKSFIKKGVMQFQQSDFLASFGLFQVLFEQKSIDVSGNQRIIFLLICTCLGQGGPGFFAL